MKILLRFEFAIAEVFAVSEIIAQHLEKSLDNELQKTNNPEYASKASTKVFATDL